MPITCFRNESGCDICSSCWPWQAQAAATVAPTHQDTLNPWIPIPVNIGFFELTKATTPRSIVMSETSAPFANPSNNNMWTVDIGGCAVEAMRRGFVRRHACVLSKSAPLDAQSPRRQHSDEGAPVRKGISSSAACRICGEFIVRAILTLVLCCEPKIAFAVSDRSRIIPPTDDTWLGGLEEVVA